MIRYGKLVSYCIEFTVFTGSGKEASAQYFAAAFKYSNIQTLYTVSLRREVNGTYGLRFITVPVSVLTDENELLARSLVPLTKQLANGRKFQESAYDDLIRIHN